MGKRTKQFFIVYQRKIYEGTVFIVKNLQKFNILKKIQKGMKLDRFIISIIVSSIIGFILFIIGLFILIKYGERGSPPATYTLSTLLFNILAPLIICFLCGALSVFIGRTKEVRECLKISFYTGLLFLFLTPMSFFVYNSEISAFSIVVVVFAIIFWGAQSIIGALVGGYLAFRIKNVNHNFSTH